MPITGLIKSAKSNQVTGIHNGKGAGMKKKIAIGISLIFLISPLYGSYNITVLGTGYVGLVSGTCFAQMGHHVVCTDINKSKIKQLSHGINPIYEPGLTDLIKRNVKGKRLQFSSSIPESIEKADIIVIAVSTPSKENGQADLAALESAFSVIINHMNNYKTIIIKSTVPIGTGNQIKTMLDSLNVPESSYDLVSNPEFLREGSASCDCLYPDRVIIGSERERAIETMKKLYENLPPKTPLVITDQTTAEAIKYASNTFLALKISFTNELANLCDATGAHTATVTRAMGLDKRISPQFLKPGPGFGGSCLPKDSLALIHTAKEHNTLMLTIQAALNANNLQKTVPVAKLRTLLGNDLRGKTISILGLAFKTNTDDIRYSSAITVIDTLLQEGAIIQAYDPKAIPNMKLLYPQLSYSDNSYDALRDAHAAIILTEWPEFSTLDLARAGELMANRIFVDCRNILDPKALITNGFRYQTIGNGGTRRITPTQFFCPDLY